MDRVVYSEDNRTTKYVIQFKDIDGVWLDSAAREHRTLTVARTYLDSMEGTSYPYRIVERVS